MIEPSLVPWIWLLIAVVLSSHTMLRFSYAMAWSQAAIRSGLPFFFGVALAPFLLGFLTIAALMVSDGASHGTHQALIYSGLGIANMISFWLPRNRERFLSPAFAVWDKVALLILALFIVGLLFNSFFYPLTQNDPLEYATVARALFDTRTLDNYPLVNPQAHASGFYAPWTHPPLYVALIYATELMQNHADMPGLMRFISPWFALCTVGILFALGNLVNRRTGLFAGITLLTTPLYFLGAGSSVIDMLPVHGFTMMIAAIVGLQGSALRKGIWLGGITGLALWTHSQAILFLPLAIAGLVLVEGLRSWRRILTLYAGLLLIGLPIAIWPYLRNLEILGALISDNPIVFDLKVLDWPSYFSINRGIDSVTAVIQYGVFKGWFAPVAFSALFWLMSFAAIYYFLRFMRLDKMRRTLMNGCPSAEALLPWVSTGIVLAYLAGVSLSVLLGIDLMIRNERYMLVIMPFVALTCGWYLNVLLQQGERWSGRRVTGVLFTTVSFTLLALHLPVFLFYCAEEHGMTFEKFRKVGTSTALLARGGYPTIHYLRNETHKESVVLSFRPSDMYYSQRRMMSFLDPRLVPFYEEKDPQTAWTLLKNLGIDYVYLPDYPLPAVYNSVMQNILADPALSQLMSAAGGYQVYRLQAQPVSATAEPVQLTEMPWIVIHQWILGGRKPLYRIIVDRNPFDITQSSLSKRPFRLWQRDFSTLLRTGTTADLPKNNTLIVVEPDTEYTIAFSLSGSGYVELFLTQYNANFHELHSGAEKNTAERLGGTVLADRDTRYFIKRIKTLPDTNYILVGLEHYGNSTLKIEKGTLKKLPQPEITP